MIFKLFKTQVKNLHAVTIEAEATIVIREVVIEVIEVANNTLINTKVKGIVKSVPVVT